MGARTSTPVINIGEPRRNSYDGGRGRIKGPGALTSPSSHSLPHDGFSLQGKGLAGRQGTREYGEYESDFETDEEDPHGVTLSNTTLTKMKLLKKKRESQRENQREIDRRRQERDTKRSQEERSRKYKELELKHSGGSLRPSRASSGESDLAVAPNISYKGKTPRPSPRPSPKPSPRPPARIPKSRSYTDSLGRGRGRGRGTGTEEKRNRSLERGVPNGRDAYRTPQLVRRGGPPASSFSGSSSLGASRSTRRPSYASSTRSSDDLTLSVSLRSAKPASSCFKDHLEPFAHPKDAMAKAHERLNSGEWESQVEGVQDIVRLTEHHPEVLGSDLRNTNQALIREAKNLRSQVSRAAIQALTRLFDTFQGQMTQDAEKIASLLLLRTSDTNKFLQLDAHHALDALVEAVAPFKAIPALLYEGLNHKSPVVKSTLCRLLAYEVERMGAQKILGGGRDITEKILPAAAKLAQEGSLETRKYAKQIFQQLIPQPGFEAALKKYVSSNDIKNIRKFLDNLSGDGRSLQESARSKMSVGSRFARTM